MFQYSLKNNNFRTLYKKIYKFSQNRSFSTHYNFFALSQGRNSSTLYTKILNLPKNLLYYLKIVLYLLKTEISKYSFIYLFRKKFSIRLLAKKSSSHSLLVKWFCFGIFYHIFSILNQPFSCSRRFLFHVWPSYPFLFFSSLERS